MALRGHRVQQANTMHSAAARRSTARSCLHVAKLFDKYMRSHVCECTSDERMCRAHAMHALYLPFAPAGRWQRSSTAPAPVQPSTEEGTPASATAETAPQRRQALRAAAAAALLPRYCCCCLLCPRPASGFSAATGLLPAGHLPAVIPEQP